MTPLNAMNSPVMTRGSAGMQTPELNLDLSADQFDQLVDQMVADGSEATDDHQRLEMLRHAMEDMDGSEILGFLAMLENQSGWQADKTSILNAADVTTATSELAENALLMEAGAHQPKLSQQASLYQSLIPDSSQGKETLQQALTTAMDKAVENYLPTVRAAENSQAELPVEPGSLALANPGETELQSMAQTVTRQDAEALKTDVSAARSEPFLNIVSGETVQSGLDLSVQSSGTYQDAMKQTAAARENAQSAPTDSRSLPNVQDERWGDALGQRLATMVTEQRQEAVMRLDPPELGSVGVRLIVENGSVSVQFASPVSQVREMLEAQADRLRAAIESEGLELADVNVGQGGEGSQQQGSSLYAENWQEAGFDTTAEPDAMDSQWSVTDIQIPLSQGLISTYA